MSLTNTPRNEEYLLDVKLNREDVKRAAENVKIEGVDPSLEPGIREIIGTGNLIISKYVQKNEGEDVRNLLNSGVVRVEEDLGGALGTYLPDSGRISILKKYVANPLKALAIYVHELGHKIMDKYFGFKEKLEERVNELWKINPLYAIYTAIFGHYLNEGITDLYFRLKPIGEKGIKSLYQVYGLVRAAEYALKKSGGKIKNLVRRLPEAIDDFVIALYNPRVIT